MAAFADLADLARRQHGLVERGQAAALGVDPRALARRVDREGWERLHAGVFALPGSLDTGERRVLAAVLAVQDHAWATRWTAAYLWGLSDRLRVPVTLTVPHQHRAAALRGVQTVRSRTLAPEDVTRRHGVPVVGVARMLADLGPVLPLSELRGLAIDARQRGLVDSAQLWAIWERLRKAPRQRNLRALALLLQGDVERVDSEFERRVRALLRRAGLPYPHPEPFPVRDGGVRVARIDIAWPRWKVGVECDGFRYHSHRRQLDRDSARQNTLIALGWRLARVTWDQIERAPDTITDVVHRLLRTAGAFRDA